MATLVRISSVRSLRVRYRGSALGVLWSFANPLLLTAVYTAIFGTAFSRYYDGSVTRYLLSVFVGLVVVTFFLNATGEALGSVVANGFLLNKIPVAPETFPLAAIIANLFQQLLTTFPLVLILSAVVARDPVRLLLVPVVMLSVTMLTAGVGLTLAALFVFFRDLQYLWGIVGFILWLTSPMFYPAEVVPLAVRPYLKLNPVAHDITALREVVINRGPIHFGEIGLALATGTVVMLLGALVFRATRRDFMDLL